MKKYKTEWKNIIIFLIILVSFTPLINNVVKAFSLVFIFLLSVFKVKKIQNGNMMILSTALLLLISPAIIDVIRIGNPSNISVLNFYFPFSFLFGFIIYQRYTLQEYLKISEKIIFVLALFSLIGVIIYTFMPQIVFQMPQYVNKHTSHRTAFIFNILTIGNHIVARNAGIAWEPGAFQFLLNLGLFSYLKYTKPKIIKILIYSIAIIATKSTVGLSIFALIIIWKLIINQENKKIKLVAIFAVLLSLGSVLDIARYHLDYKLNPDVTGFDVRISPMLNAIDYGKNYIFGIGNSNYDQMYSQLNIGSYDSYTQVFLRYGYFLLLFIISRLIKIVRNDLILGAIIIGTFFGQSIWFFPFITPFYFLREERRV